MSRGGSNMWRIVAAVLTFTSGVLAQSCGTTREVSPGLADAGVFPWIGLIYYRNREVPENRYGAAYAIGALFDKQHVLTSEYLANSVNVEELYVQFGATDTKNAVSALNYTVEKLFSHRNPLTVQVGDISILRLKEPVKFTEKASPVCLPAKDQEYEAENYYYVSYNLNDYVATSTIPKQKKILQIPRVTAADCEKLYKKAWSLINAGNSDMFVCAGGVGDADSCHLDTTLSPLFSESPAGWTVLGLHQFGPDECGTGIPGAFLSVKSQLDWIQTVVKS